MPFRTHHILLGAALLVLCACKFEPEPAPVIGYAFVGPYQLDVIAELDPEAGIIATLEHGQRVDIIERRRRFARVRTAAGLEGWTDGRQLLSASAMARLRRLAMNAARLPSQGKATVFDTLNVHIEPNRQAPSFYQMQEGILAEVVAHRVMTRTPYEPLEDSDTGVEALNSYARPSAVPEGVVDDWSLLRLGDGRAGWVLSSMLAMAIPDEVAHYAGGYRITSYASLGQVEDNGQIKHHWLWTTQSRGGRTYQFDGFRVFVWSLRRHRYETAFRQRNVIGYYPVQVLAPDENAKGARQMSRFSLTIREGEDRTYQRIYSFSGYRVKLEEEFPWEAPPEIRRVREGEYVDLPADKTPSLFQELVQRVITFFTEETAEQPE